MSDTLFAALLYLESVEFLRFVGVGSVNAGLYFLVFTTLVLSKVHYKVSACIAFALGLAVSFVLHKFWTFRDMQLETVGFQMLLFTLKKLTFFFVNYKCLAYMVEAWGHKPVRAQIGLGAVGGIASYVTTRYIFSF